MVWPSIWNCLQLQNMWGTTYLQYQTGHYTAMKLYMRPIHQGRCKTFCMCFAQLSKFIDGPATTRPIH